MGENHTNTILDNQLYFSCFIFIGFMIIVFIVVNYKLVLSWISSKKPVDKSEPLTVVHEGGKNIFYVGGYDYMDYSD